MAFKPGSKKPEASGRKPGTPNKKTIALLEIFEQFDFCPAEKVVELLLDKTADLIPKERADLYMKLMEFKFPKRKSIEHTGANGSDLLNRIIGEISGSNGPENGE